jgi:hypothetical protein
VIGLMVGRNYVVHENISYIQPELFGPGHFVRLGLGLRLRLKSEIRTRTWART